VLSESLRVVRDRGVQLVPPAVGVVEAAIAAGQARERTPFGLGLEAVCGAVVVQRTRRLRVQVVVAPPPQVLRLEECVRAEQVAVLSVSHPFGRILPHGLGVGVDRVVVAGASEDAVIVILDVGMSGCRWGWEGS
jgi:hypothetical protein